LSAKFRLAETKTYLKALEKLKIPGLAERIHEVVYPEIATSPLGGANIKKLKGAYHAVYRFRIGDYRIFYVVDESERIVFLTDIQNRKDAYKKRK